MSTCCLEQARATICDCSCGGYNQTVGPGLPCLVHHKPAPPSRPVNGPSCQRLSTLAVQAQARDFSFCIFARTNPVRKLAIGIVGNPWFNRLLLCIILANCVFLAIANPVCDTNVEIQENPECQNSPKWTRVGSLCLQVVSCETRIRIFYFTIMICCVLHAMTA